MHKKLSSQKRFAGFILVLAIGSLGASYAMLEIGPIATISGPNPEIRFLDSDVVDQSWEVEAFNDYFEISKDGEFNGFGAFKIFRDANPDSLTLADESVVINGEESADAANPLALEVFANSFDNQAGMSISTDASNSPAAVIFEVDRISNLFNTKTKFSNAITFNSPIRTSLEAPDDSLAIDADGDVGIGVNPSMLNPDADLHIASDTAVTSVFMDNSSSSDWRIFSGPSGLWFNSTDGTNTNAVKFGNDAPGNSLVVEEASGEIGVGTSVPTASLHVRKQDQTAKIRVEEASGVTANRDLFELINNGGCAFTIENTDAATRWDFRNASNGAFAVNLLGTGGPELQILESGRLLAGPGGFKAMDLEADGDLIIAGTLMQSSDRNKKENFASVDCQDVLEKVRELPVTSWNYRSDDHELRHIGPMAQDFHAAFEVGMDDKTIAMADALGVSLAAIKALDEQNDINAESIEETNHRIEQENKQLKQELLSLQSRMAKLEKALESVVATRE